MHNVHAYIFYFYGFISVVYTTLNNSYLFAVVLYIIFAVLLKIEFRVFCSVITVSRTLYFSPRQQFQW